MNYADIVVGGGYKLVDINRIGRPGQLANLTLNDKLYFVLDKVAPDAIVVMNDIGRRITLKAFRLGVWEEPQFDPFRLDDNEQEFIEAFLRGGNAKQQPPFEWKAGAIVRLRDETDEWFEAHPAANNPGWVRESMGPMRGKVFEVNRITFPYVKIKGDEWDYSFAKEWFVREDGTEIEEVVPVVQYVEPPKHKFKRGDIVVVEKKAGDWIADMDETIGETTVIALHELKGDWFKCDNGFKYVADALRLATDEEKKLAKAALLREAQYNNIKVMKEKAGGVSSFAIFTDTKHGIDVDNTFAGICHASLNRYGDPVGTVGVTDYLFPYETQVAKEQHADYKAYIDYVINRSPWHIAYKKSSVDRALKEGLHMKVDKTPAKIIGAACVSLRMGKEFSATRLPIYTLVLNAGYEEAVAWLVMQGFVQEGERILQSNPTGAHTVMDTETKIGPVVSLMRFGYDEASLKDKPYTEYSKYTGFTNQLSYQKDYLDNVTSFPLFVQRNMGKVAKEGQGFDVKSVVTEKNIFAVADAFTKLFHQLDVMEF